MCVLHLSLSFILLDNFAEACFFSFCRRKPTKTTNNNTGSEGVGLGISIIASSSLGDRKRIPKTASVVGETTFDVIDSRRSCVPVWFFAHVHNSHSDVACGQWKACCGIAILYLPHRS